MLPQVDQPGKDDVQHGIAVENDILWPIQDHHADRNDDGTPVNASTLIDYYFLDGEDDQKLAVRCTIEKRLKPRGAKFVTWEDCANVKFRLVQKLPAHIRISFNRGTGPAENFWSGIGRYLITNYLDRERNMSLVGLPSECPPTEFYRGSILHEFGHALGLVHEHQSPTLEGHLGTTLNEKALIAEHGRKVAMEQYIVKPTNPFNYTRFDKDSIMLYYIEKRWLTDPPRWYEGWFSKKTAYNQKLSELDQAFIRLLYPPDLSIQANVKPFRKAMEAAGVPLATAGMVLNIYAQDQGTLPQRLNAVRAAFNTADQQAIRLWEANRATLQNSIDPATLRRSGITGFVGEVTKDKLFQAIVKNIVHRTIEPNVSFPGNNRNEVKRMLGALAMHDSFGHTVKYYDDQLGRKSDAPKPSELRDDTGDKETPDTPDTPDTAQLDFEAWTANAEGSGTATVTKSKDEMSITIDAWKSIKVRALLTWKQGRSQFISQNIDAKGLLYFKDQDLITTGTKAKWTLGWVAFYHDEWKIENVVACFCPVIHGYSEETDLRSDNELVDKVIWESNRRV